MRGVSVARLMYNILFSHFVGLPRHAAAVGLPPVAPRGGGKTQVLGPPPDLTEALTGGVLFRGAASSEVRRAQGLRCADLARR